MLASEAAVRLTCRYLPHCTLIAVFGWRMRKHLVELFRDGPGPWTAHISKEDLTAAVSANAPAEPLLQEVQYQRLN